MLLSVGGMLRHLTPAGEPLASKIPEERQISAKVALNAFSQPATVMLTPLVCA